MTNSLSKMFGWGTVATAHEMPDIFPMSVMPEAFIRTDIRNLYAKILTDTLERTQGISDQQQQVLWDNCLQSESSKGLVTLLSEAMEQKNDLVIVYNPALGTIRKASGQETVEIKADYEKKGKSSKGVFVSFKHYDRTDMIRLYTALEYCVISSLNKSMNLSRALQFKMSNMRGSVSLADSTDVKTQAIEVAQALAKGRDVMIDGDDVIDTAKPDLTAAKEGMLFVSAKRSYYLGMPISYITGEQTTGIGSTGEADTKAIDRGLKGYYFSIIKPTVEAIFGIKTTFNPQDFAHIESGLEALKMFELVSDQFISDENKLLIVNKLFGVDSPLGEKPEPVPVVVAPNPNQTTKPKLVEPPKE